MLAALASRLGNSRDQEFARCIAEIAEIGKIARLRLAALFGKG